MGPPRARNEGRDEPAEEHICRWEEGGKCVYVCVWMGVRVSVHACVCISTCERFHFSMQVCDVSVWRECVICECVWTRVHKQRRERHQGPAITRNAPTSGSRLAELQLTNGLAAPAGPPPKPLWERDYHPGRRPKASPSLFSPVSQIVLPPQPGALDSSGRNYSAGHVDSHAAQKKKKKKLRKARGKSSSSVWVLAFSSPSPIFFPHFKSL